MGRPRAPWTRPPATGRRRGLDERLGSGPELRRRQQHERRPAARHERRRRARTTTCSGSTSASRSTARTGTLLYGPTTATRSARASGAPARRPTTATRSSCTTSWRTAGWSASSRSRRPGRLPPVHRRLADARPDRRLVSLRVPVQHDQDERLPASSASGRTATTCRSTSSPAARPGRGQGVAVFERAKMLARPAGSHGQVRPVRRDPNLGGMLPSDLDGPTRRRRRSQRLRAGRTTSLGLLARPAPDLGVPRRLGEHRQLDVHARPRACPTAAFDSNLCGYARNCIPQPGTTRELDALSDRLMYRLQYRNFGDHQTLVVNHTVDVDGTDHAGIRWYELRNTGAGWAITSRAPSRPTATNRWMGSAAMDESGDIALGYSVSSGDRCFPAIRYSGRVVGGPAGTMPRARRRSSTAPARRRTRGAMGRLQHADRRPDRRLHLLVHEGVRPDDRIAPGGRASASFTFPGCGSSAADGRHRRPSGPIRRRAPPSPGQPSRSRVVHPPRATAPGTTRSRASVGVRTRSRPRRPATRRARRPR